jgi:hypothetical protein
MRCDVVIKTWYNDLAFLSYALRFLEKNWLEPDSNVIVLANADCHRVIATWGFPPRFKYFYVNPWPDGNQFQTYLTLLYDNFSDAEMFVVLDSDTMLVRPTRLKDLFKDDKPVIHCEHFHEGLLEDRVLAHKLWVPIMEHWLGQKPQADYMFAFPFLYYADSIAAVRRVITAKTGLGLLESLYSNAPFNPENFINHPFKFCEHNVISFYCALYEKERYYFRGIDEITDQERANWPVKAFHSWTQWSADTQETLEGMLAA